MTRRELLIKAIKGGLFSLVISVTTVFVIFTYPARLPARLREKKVVFYDVLPEDDLPGRGVRKVDFVSGQEGRQMSVYIVKAQSGWIVLSPICTHLGCLVTYSSHKNRFLCPCHGGKYDVQGNVIEGPPPGPLTRLQMKVEAGRVYIGVKA